jgi:hypothetical protein
MQHFGYVEEALGQKHFLNLVYRRQLGEMVQQPHEPRAILRFILDTILRFDLAYTMNSSEWPDLVKVLFRQGRPGIRVSGHVSLTDITKNVLQLTKIIAGEPKTKKWALLRSGKFLTPLCLHLFVEQLRGRGWLDTQIEDMVFHMVTQQQYQYWWDMASKREIRFCFVLEQDVQLAMVVRQDFWVKLDPSHRSLDVWPEVRDAIQDLVQNKFFGFVTGFSPETKDDHAVVLLKALVSAKKTTGMNKKFQMSPRVLEVRHAALFIILFCGVEQQNQEVVRLFRDKVKGGVPSIYGVTVHLLHQKGLVEGRVRGHGIADPWVREPVTPSLQTLHFAWQRSKRDFYALLGLGSEDFLKYNL